MLGEVKGSSSNPAIAPEPIFLDLYNFYIRSCGSCGETLSLCIFLKKQVDKLSVYHTQGLDQNRKFFRQSQDITSARGITFFSSFPQNGIEEEEQEEEDPAFSLFDNNQIQGEYRVREK